MEAEETLRQQAEIDEKQMAEAYVRGAVSQNISYQHVQLLARGANFVSRGIISNNYVIRENGTCIGEEIDTK